MAAGQVCGLFFLASSEVEYVKTNARVSDAQITFVVLVFPVCMNVLQVWI